MILLIIIILFKINKIYNEKNDDLIIETQEINNTLKFKIIKE